MADQPLNVFTREIPRFAAQVTITCADQRPTVVAALGFYDRAIVLMSVVLWSYGIGFGAPYLRFGRGQVCVPNGAEYWRISATLAPVESPLENEDVFRAVWRLHL